MAGTSRLPRKVRKEEEAARAVRIRVTGMPTGGGWVAVCRNNVAVMSWYAATRAQLAVAMRLACGYRRAAL